MPRQYPLAFFTHNRNFFCDPGYLVIKAAADFIFAEIVFCFTESFFQGKIKKSGIQVQTAADVF